MAIGCKILVHTPYNVKRYILERTSDFARGFSLPDHGDKFCLLSIALWTERLSLREGGFSHAYEHRQCWCLSSVHASSTSVPRPYSIQRIGTCSVLLLSPNIFVLIHYRIRRTTNTCCSLIVWTLYTFIGRRHVCRASPSRGCRPGNFCSFIIGEDKKKSLSTIVPFY